MSSHYLQILIKINELLRCCWQFLVPFCTFLYIWFDWQKKQGLMYCFEWKCGLCWCCKSLFNNLRARPLIRWYCLQTEFMMLVPENLLVPAHARNPWRNFLKLSGSPPIDKDKIQSPAWKRTSRFVWMISKVRIPGRGSLMHMCSVWFEFLSLPVQTRSLKDEKSPNEERIRHLKEMLTKWSHWTTSTGSIMN